jgi:hypothetical protein
MITLRRVAGGTSVVTGADWPSRRMFKCMIAQQQNTNTVFLYLSIGSLAGIVLQHAGAHWLTMGVSFLQPEQLLPVKHGGFISA